MASLTPDGARDWYIAARPTYVGLADLLRGMIEGLLRGAGVDYLSVSSRAKEIESFAEKIGRKGYSEPQVQMTDLCGVRVICYIERDVQLVAQIINDSFRVHPEKSPNKWDTPDVDRFGYRSLHFVCDLGQERVRLPEYQIYRELTFEVQVRTVLQHGWAEIEHDRSYKLSGTLPKDLRRRLHSVAGMLEVADREFDAIAAAVDAYAEEVAEKTRTGDLNVDVDSTSVREYLISRLTPHGVSFDLRPRVTEDAVAELRAMGINSLAQLDSIMSDEFIKAAQEHDALRTDVGILRSAMMYSDIDRYFSEAWQQNWLGMADNTQKLLAEKWGTEKVAQYQVLTFKPLIETQKRRITRPSKKARDAAKKQAD